MDDPSPTPAELCLAAAAESDEEEEARGLMFLAQRYARRDSARLDGAGAGADGNGP